MIPPPETTLAGRFRIAGPPLGRGATGVVLPAVDLHSGREVAVKVLHDHLAGDAGALRTLEAEARAVGRLKHRHILEVLGLWSDRGRWFVVTERIDGMSLEELTVPLAPQAALALASQVADALVSAHGAGIVHGDVRPGNVLVGGRGAVLFDFGVAAWLAAADEAGGRVRPGESAPEVHAGGAPTVVADLYGLGVVLYRAVTGRNPWRGATAFGVIGAQVAGPPALPELPRGLAYLIGELLDPDPTVRPTDTQRVAAALRRLQRRPARLARTTGRWFAPIRVFTPWVVHGTDPATGGPAVVRGDLTWARARDLEERLSEEGWQVRIDQDALGLRDLIQVALLALALGILIPGLGFAIGAVVGLRWRSARCRVQLRSALPAVVAAVPPRQVAPGNELAVAAGVLLLATALLLALWPLAALLPAGLLLPVLRSWWRTRAPDAAEAALRARLQTAILAVRRGIELRVRDLDLALTLHGDLDAVERGWSGGELDPRVALERLTGLAARVDQIGVDPADTAATTLGALRQSGSDLGPSSSR